MKCEYAALTLMCWLCLVCCTISANAQTGTGIIQGKVLSAGDVALEGVTIRLNGKTTSTRTDANGSFTLSNISAGDYVLVLSRVGYATLRQPVQVLAGKTAKLNLRLEEKVETLQEVEVNGTRGTDRVTYLQDVEGVGVYSGKKTEVINPDRTDANLALNNTRQVLARVPGISIWENDGSGIQVGVAARGLSPNRSWEFNVRQNGYDVSADPLGYPEAYYNPPMEAVQQLQVVRGAASLQYGPQFGGLLNYVLKSGDSTRKLAVETQHTAGSYGLYNTYNGVGGQVGKLNYYGALNYRRADGWRENSRYDYFWGYGSLQYAFSSRLKVGFQLSRTYFENQQPGGLTDAQFAENPRQAVRGRNWFSAPWTIPAFNLNYQISPSTRLDVKAFGVFGQRNSVGFVAAATVPDTINTNTGDFNNRQLDRDLYRNFGAEARLLTQYGLLGGQHTLATGVRYFNGFTERKQLGRGTTGRDFDLTLLDSQYRREYQFGSQNVAFFAENIFRPFPKLAVTPGLRFEHLYTTSAGRMNIATDGTPLLITPQAQTRTFVLFGLGLEYTTTATTNVYANISQAYRPVQFADLVPPATTDEIDPNLKDAKGYNADFGFRGTVGDFLRFDLGGFYLHYDGRIGTLTQTREDGTRYQYRTNIGTSVSKGTELYAEVDPVRAFLPSSRIGSLTLFTSMAYVDARYTAGSVVSGTTNAELKGKRVENAPRHINRFGITYVLKGFSTTYQLSYVNAAFSDANNTVASDNGNNGVIPEYQVMDWSFTYRFPKTFNLKGGVNNLADTRYFTRRAGGYPGPGLVPGDGRTFYLTVGARF
jgi:Fe(3+) dicitrate transport protein